MKRNYLIYMFVFFAFAKIGNSQNTSSSLSEVSGLYILNNNPENLTNTAHWKLELFPDGRYEYLFKRQLQNQEVENFYSQDTYSAQGLVVTFMTKNPSSEQNQTFNLNGTKARIHKKHPRNKHPKKEPIFIQFISSEEKAIKGLKLYKEDA